MNIWSSECSSGCESGWTTYLDHYSNSSSPYAMSYAHNYEERGANANENNRDEDEDLSMVSDASSGPPNRNYVSDPHYCGYAQEDSKKSKQKKSRTKETKIKKEHSFCLDDTASSSVLHFSQDNAVPPEQEQFQGESVSKKRLGFLKSSTKGKSGSLLGRK